MGRNSLDQGIDVCGLQYPKQYSVRNTFVHLADEENPPAALVGWRHRSYSDSDPHVQCVYADNVPYADRKPPVQSQETPRGGLLNQPNNVSDEESSKCSDDPCGDNDGSVQKRRKRKSGWTRQRVKKASQKRLAVDGGKDDTDGFESATSNFDGSHENIKASNIALCSVPPILSLISSGIIGC